MYFINSRGDYIFSFKYSLYKSLNRKIIEIKKSIIKNNKFCYNFYTSEELNEYFLKKESFIEHINIQEDLASVPEGISIIPILCNILPVNWVFDATIILNELDKSFFF